MKISANTKRVLIAAAAAALFTVAVGIVGSVELGMDISNMWWEIPLGIALGMVAHAAEKFLLKRVSKNAI